MNKKPDWKVEFCTMLEKLAERRSIWKVWNDFITLAAITISNLVKTSSWDEREEEYLSIIHTYKKEEQDIIVQLFAVMQLAYEENDKQDFLGNICQELELLQRLKKQYFSSYNVSVASAEFVCEKLIWNDRLEMKGYLSVYDPACGTGTMLIAFAHMLQKCGQSAPLDGRVEDLSEDEEEKRAS